MKYKDSNGIYFNSNTTGYIGYSGFTRCTISKFNALSDRHYIRKIESGPLRGLYCDKNCILHITMRGKQRAIYGYPEKINIVESSNGHSMLTNVSQLSCYTDILGNNTIYRNAFGFHRIVFKDKVEYIYRQFEVPDKYMRVGAGLYLDESVYNCEYALEQIKEEYDLVYTNEGDLKDIDDCVFIESESEYYLKDSDDICYVHEYGEYMLRSECIYSRNLDCWIYHDSENYIFCSDIEDYVSSDDAYFDEALGEYVSEMPKDKTRICEYHRSPEPEVIYNNNTGAHRYSIGFEVEKNSILGKRHEGDYIGEYRFFSGFENDSSCGVEGISNIYCLEYGYNTLVEHVKAAEDILNDENVNSDCGGHINVSGPSDIINLANIRKYSGLLFAMYRYRLQKSYSSHNKKLEEYNKNTKYSAIREKNNSVGYNRTLIEFRLISKVEHSNQILFRYKLIQRLIKAAEKGISFEEYLKSNQALLKSIYSEEKLNRINAMAISFNTWINAEEYTEVENNIQKYL